MYPVEGIPVVIPSSKCEEDYPIETPSPRLVEIISGFIFSSSLAQRILLTRPSQLLGPTLSSEFSEPHYNTRTKT